MIRVPMRRFGRGSILGITGLLIALAVLQPRIFNGADEAGTRGLPRADRAAEVRQPAAAAPAASAPAAPSSAPADATHSGAPTAGQPSAEVLAAAQLLTDRIEANPRDVDAWLELGNLLMKENDATRGTEAFAAAVEADPSRADAHALLGRALLFSGQLRLSRAELQRALAIDPTLAEANLNLGITYSHAAPADLVAARAAWTRAVELAPGTEIARQAGEYLAAYAEPAAAAVPEARP